MIHAALEYTITIHINPSNQHARDSTLCKGNVRTRYEKRIGCVKIALLDFSSTLKPACLIRWHVESEVADCNKVLEWIKYSCSVRIDQNRLLQVELILTRSYRLPCISKRCSVVPHIVA